MKGYSGEDTFDYDVERPEKPGANDYISIRLKIRGRSFYSPGIYHSRPEDCSPDEGNTEIISVTDESGKDWLDLLTKEEKEEIVQLIQEKVEDLNYYN